MATCIDRTREKDFLAYWQYLREGTFLPEASPIAYGACKQARTLDYIAEKAATKKRLHLKTKEKALLRTALYQFYFMRAPRWAVGQEMGNLAKKYCHPFFANFLNALMRQLPDELPRFPNLAIRYSYPDELVEELLGDYPPATVEKILELGNLSSKTFARKRPGFEMVEVVPDDIAALSLSQDVYLMNKAPAELIDFLARDLPPPRSLLDLCSSPGGKLLALHDLFPQAQLFANDVSEQKLKRLQENCEKYRLKVSLSEHLGQHYPETTKFDLIVLDVPCSNTGVMRKHPEARWRINDLVPLQNELLNKARRLVHPDGHILFLNCSVLKRETPTGPKRLEKQILPDEEGRDGAYGCIL
jgi:16S rRNA (cytosine967-C5)-methyltransferase